ncbi:hypothetical protein [Zestomonas carbonaria]|uniref:Uncharacterized protein n=1 Tax=Zestomonas carbonaria TaxID=2762745 RepID=A0A7U7ETD9_9GAMM|nr:hypothetical protein [Pseudomonas carbonaria]CAD5110407.1 hypothetical protein PSEWESI4_04730 [Pseudomonas carbonaria]
MSNSALDTAYETLAQDALEGNLPHPATVCKDCTEIGVPFSLNTGDGPRDADLALGIPSTETAATETWFTSNPWINDELQNFRDTFALRVLMRLGELKGEAFLAEFQAYIKSRGFELDCLDYMIDEGEVLTPPELENITHGTLIDKELQCADTNFNFHGKNVYYWTFTTARFTEGGHREGVFYNPFPPVDWHVSGRFDIDRAAQCLVTSFEQQKQRDKQWEVVKMVGRIGLGILTFIPAVRVVTLGARGLRYSIAVIEAVMSANEIASGSTSLIKGEGIDLGETMFESLAKLADPKSDGERGRQVFMFINLALIAPSIQDGARWVLRRIWNTPSSIRYDLKALPEPDRKALNNHASAEPKAIELRGSRRGRSNDDSVEWFDRPSLDTNSSQVGLTTATGKANYAVMTNTLRARLAMLILHNGGKLRVTGRVGKVVGDAGEEVLVAALIERMKFRPENILGYSLDPSKIPHRIGLSNKSNQGLDVLVYVPPPPSLEVRVPTTGAMRHGIDGMNGKAETEKIHFTKKTLLVFETKTTLSKDFTPDFNPTQRNGLKKVNEVKRNISGKKRRWKPHTMRQVDPDYMGKLDAIEEAQKSGDIAFIHAQVFLDEQGIPRKLVGGGSGIQLNIW